MCFLAIKWWLESSKHSCHPTAMIILPTLAILGWALFAASIDRAQYHPYFALKGQQFGLVFNTLTLWLMFKNLIKIKAEVPSFVGKTSFLAKTILFVLYQILLILHVLGLLSFYDQKYMGYLENFFVFASYLFYFTFAFDLQPKKLWLFIYTSFY